jgi:hypothetical protein
MGRPLLHKQHRLQTDKHKEPSQAEAPALKSYPKSTATYLLNQMLAKDLRTICMGPDSQRNCCVL